MAEFDLVPNDYRTRLWRERWIKSLGIVVVGLLLVSITVYSALIYAKSTVKTEIEVLQAKRTITTQQTAELNRLRKQKAEFEYQWTLLNGLRGGTLAEQTFITIDRAQHGNDVWFLNWNFRRAGVSVKPEQKIGSSGYFVVVPIDEKRSKQEAWRIETHMAIKGKALDHAALSKFVKALFRQPEIHDVRVLKTSLSRYMQNSVVEFDLAVVVNSNAGKG